MVEVTMADVNITDTTYIDQFIPATNYGNATDLFTKSSSTENKRTLIKLVMPSKPAGAVGKPRPTIKLVCSGRIGTGTHFHQAFKVTRGATEVLEGTGASDGATWDTYNGSNAWDLGGGDYGQFLSQCWVATSTTVYFDCLLAALDWGESCWVLIRYAVEDAGSALQRQFSSDDHGTDAYRPKLIVKYDDDAPTSVTDLIVSPQSADPRTVHLKWSPNRDTDFVRYEIRSSTTSPVTYSSSLVATITNQFWTAYDQAGANTENQVVYYAIFVEDNNNVDANGAKSNEVFAIRPDVSTFTLTDTTPDLFQEIVVSALSATAYPSTPIPVQNTDAYIEWGSAAEIDDSSCWVPWAERLRKHRYPYSTTETPKCQIKNSLGLCSDLTGLTTGGPTLTVAQANPVAKIRASPRLVATNTDALFYADESYCPAGNKTLASSNAYEWDKDYSGSFSADYTTTVPYQPMQWTGAGTKTVALRVKDQDANYSAVVSMTVIVSTETTVSLDTLADGFEVLDVEYGRHGGVIDGIEAFEIVSASEMPMEASIGGFAYTDTDTDGIPDDIETLLDVSANNKKVSLTIKGTSRTGKIIGKIRDHIEGGWVGKYNWSCTIALE